VVAKLVTVGAGVMWAAATLAAHYVLGFGWPLALLLGAILSVTGPTVIGPLLRHVRPVGAVGPILRWEGIVIDPIGALLAVLVFQAISAAGAGHAVPGVVAHGMVVTVFVGVAIGATAAALLVVMLRYYWIPDYLHSPVTLMLVAGAFTGANVIQHDSGLFATTVMGILLANQRIAAIHHIHEFKENLSVLLISSLFIVLGSRLEVWQLAEIRWGHVAFLAVLILVARPVSVLASTAGRGVTWRERAFLAWMAPRGVVAASVASVFAIELKEAGMAGADQIVPTIFAVIIGTVTVYGLTAAPLARRLGLARPDALGFLIVGAGSLARMIAKVLQEEGFEVVMVDTNNENIAAARLDGLSTFAGSVNSEQLLERIQLSGVGRLLALTPSDTVNALAASRFAKLFGRAGVYQVASHVDPESPKAKVAAEQRGRTLFGAEMTFDRLADRVEAGAVIKRTKLTEQFTMEQFRAANPGAVVLFMVEATGAVTPATADAPVAAKAGQTVIWLS
jgi:NhaP-type Na+/H+ or K+/H+ antiporter